jgi:hypothetical protein
MGVTFSSTPAGASTTFDGVASVTAFPAMSSLSGLFLISAFENPYSDLTALTGSPTANASLLSPSVQYASLSSPPMASQGTSEQNYIAYAMGGVSWIHFRNHGGTHTASYAVHNLTVVQLAAIWNDTLTCTVNSVTYTMNWKCVGGDVAPIDCYTAAAGSGTGSAWRTLTNTGNPACLNNEAVGTVGMHTVAENEISSIVNVGDEQDAIFFFSVGSYQQNCVSDACPGNAGWKTELGSINGIAPSKANIQGSGGGGVPGPWPASFYLYNVYDNSSSATPASQATLNFVSEYGFLCKKETSSTVDPNSSVDYRTEIENDITSAGFFPLDTSPSSPFSEGSLTWPALITVSGYRTVDPDYGNLDPSGYCLSING